jgi:hypothetical protein
MWVTNWARRHTRRVIQRLVEYSLGLSESGSEVELRFFDTNSKDFNRSSVFEYVVCRMSPEEALKLAGELDTWAVKARGDPHKDHAFANSSLSLCNNSDSWRQW